MNHQLVETAQSFCKVSFNENNSKYDLRLILFARISKSGAPLTFSLADLLATIFLGLIRIAKDLPANGANSSSITQKFSTSAGRSTRKT